MASSSAQNYIPGVCNIGSVEIQMRKRIGWIGLIVTVVLWVLFILSKLAAPWFLVLFLPAFMSAAGFIQGFTHFCAGFGIRGLFNFGSEIGKADTVMQAEFRDKDRKKALQIFAWSGLIGLLVAVIAFFIK